MSTVSEAGKSPTTSNWDPGFGLFGFKQTAEGPYPVLSLFSGLRQPDQEETWEKTYKYVVMQVTITFTVMNERGTNQDDKKEQKVPKLWIVQAGCFATQNTDEIRLLFANKTLKSE